jgi:hypothetical protein
MIARLVAALAVVALALAAGATADARPLVVKPVVISLTAKNGRPIGGVKRPTVTKGKLVRFVVRTNLGREVHLHGYDIEKRVVAGRPTVLQFTAKIRGRFELELHHPDVLLAELTVK